MPTATADLSPALEARLRQAFPPTERKIATRILLLIAERPLAAPEIVEATRLGLGVVRLALRRLRAAGAATRTGSPVRWSALDPADGPPLDLAAGTIRVPLTDGREVTMPIGEAIGHLAAAGGKAMDNAQRLHAFRERARAILAPAGDDVEVDDSNEAVQVVDAETDFDEWERRGPGAWVTARVWVHDHDEFCREGCTVDAGRSL